MAQLLVVGYLRETVNSIRECVFRDYAGLDPNSAKLISQLNIKMTELGLPLEPVQDPRDRDYLIKLQIILRLDKSSEETLIGFINRTEQKAVTFDWQLRIRCILDARSKILCCIVNQNQLYYNPTVKNSMQCKTELEDHGAEDAPLRGLLAQLKALRASTARAPLGAHSVKLEGHRHLLPGRTARKWQYGPLKNHLRKAREYMEADFYRRSWKQKAKACPSQSEFRIPDAAALLTLEKYKKKFDSYCENVEKFALAKTDLVKTTVTLELYERATDFYKAMTDFETFYNSNAKYHGIIHFTKQRYCGVEFAYEHDLPYLDPWDDEPDLTGGSGPDSFQDAGNGGDESKENYDFADQDSLASEEEDEEETKEEEKRRI